MDVSTAGMRLWMLLTTRDSRNNTLFLDSSYNRSVLCHAYEVPEGHYPPSSPFFDTTPRGCGLFKQNRTALNY
ncbi:hypothetical protein PMIN03_005454 [Paraphaeosphaeria minitans]